MTLNYGLMVDALIEGIKEGVFVLERCTSPVRGEWDCVSAKDVVQVLTEYGEDREESPTYPTNTGPCSRHAYNDSGEDYDWIK